MTCVIFLVYFSNVVAGAVGLGVFLSDVVEMLILLVACICFVATMIIHEQAAGTRVNTTNDDSQ